MPLLECNLECNRDACASQPIPLVLDWDEELPEEITSLGQIDIVMYAFSYKFFLPLTRSEWLM